MTTFTVKNLEGNYRREVANQFVISDGETTIFQSYSSPVVKTWLENGTRRIVFGRDWDYSKTTMKYVHRFLAEYCGRDWTATDFKKRFAFTSMNMID